MIELAQVKRLVDNIHSRLSLVALSGSYNDLLDKPTNIDTATKLQTARTIDGVSFDGSSDIIHFGVCSTPGSTAAKTVSCSSFKLAMGSEISVKFTNSNTANNPTLNVNNTGSKAIYYAGSIVEASYLEAEHVYHFVYDGSKYILSGDHYLNRSESKNGTNVSTVTTGDKYRWNHINIPVDPAETSNINIWISSN